MTSSGALMPPVAGVADSSQRLPVLTMPATRAGCADVPRPCPHARCRYHLDAPESDAHPGLFDLLDVPPAVTLLALDAPGRTRCALDIADENPDGMTIEELAAVLGASREVTRREVVDALAEMLEHFDDEVADQLRDILRD